MTDHFDPTPTVSEDAAGVRRFDDAGIQAAVDRALASLPADRKLAAVAHATLSGASLTLVARLGSQWSVAAACYKPWRGALAAEGKVVWSPF